MTISLLFFYVACSGKSEKIYYDFPTFYRAFKKAVFASDKKTIESLMTKVVTIDVGKKKYVPRRDAVSRLDYREIKRILVKGILTEKSDAYRVLYLPSSKNNKFSYLLFFEICTSDENLKKYNVLSGWRFYAISKYWDYSGGLYGPRYIPEGPAENIYE